MRNGRNRLFFATSSLWILLSVAGMLTTAAFVAPSPALAAQLAHFESAPPRLGSDSAEDRKPTPIQGVLSRPKGAGPFPAVVLLHSCLGPPSDRRSMVDGIADWGYVALFVDDFTTRGVKETCAVDFPEGISDAYGALSYLATLPYVDLARVAVVGFSQGADTALQIATARFASAFDAPRGVRFKAAAALYPPCANLSGAVLALPTLVLIGESDSVTPAADCERLAKNQQAPGDDFKLVVYPGVGHGFDNPDFAGGKRLLGMRLGYDAVAAEKARSELHDFLAAKLVR